MKVLYPPAFWKRQPDAVLNQPIPVQNAWYTVLDSKRPARIYCLAITVLVTDETLELRITVDGQVITGSIGVTAGQNNYAYIYTSATLTAIAFTTTPPQHRSFQTEGHSVKVEVRKTTAAGAGNLQAAVGWAKIP